MKTNLMTKLIVFLFSAAIAMNSCSSDDDNTDYDGENEIYLECKSTKTLIETDEEYVEVDIMLSKTSEQDVVLEFCLENTKFDSKDILYIEENPITIKKGEKTGKLKIFSNQKGLVKEDASFKINLKSSIPNDMKLVETVSILVKPSYENLELTEDQKELIRYYNDNLGIDIKQWLGVVPAKTVIYYPGGGYTDFFSSKSTKEIESKILITLSDKSTKETPVLAMIENAMGMSQYLHDIVKNETYLDDSFWTQTPSGEMAIELLGLSEDKTENFNVLLDNIRIDIQNKTAQFLSDEVLDPYEEYILAVPFTYEYSAWDRMEKLIEEGNQDAIDANNQGGTLNPNTYLNNTAINEDYWEEGNWKAPEASFDVKTGEFEFYFCMDHMNAADYFRVEVTLNPVCD